MKLLRLTYLLMLVCSIPAIAEADWPQYRGDLQRTGFVEQPLNGSQWKVAWTYQTRSEAKPTWPAPARGSLWQNLEKIQARVVHDRSDHPLIVQDSSGTLHVIIALSGSDRILSLNPVTGQIEWQYVADGPIRFAPCSHQGTLWFGCDDGFVRALEIASGALLWEQRIGPALPLIVGNGRLISPHPIRTSVLVAGNQLFATAGLFPSQGVYCVSLNPETGALNWRVRSDQSPQGYSLWAGDDRLILPAGRAQPFMLDAKNGQLLAQLASPGGAFCMVSDQGLFAGPGNSPQLAFYRGSVSPSPPATKMLPLENEIVATGKGLVWSADTNSVSCRNLQDLGNSNDSQLAPIWSRPISSPQAMIASGKGEHCQLFVASGKTITAFDALTGDPTQTLDASEFLAPEESIQSLAVSADEAQQQCYLIANSNQGTLLAWLGTSATQEAPFAPSASANNAMKASTSPLSEQSKAPQENANNEELVKAIKRLPSDKGLGLLLVPNSLGSTQHHHALQLATFLSAQTELHLVIVTTNHAVVGHLRESLLATSLYGERVSVRPVNSLEQLPFADQIFNLIVDLRKSPSSPEPKRVLAAGGVFIQAAEGEVPTAQVKPLDLQTGTWQHQYGNPNNTASTQDAYVGAAREFRLRWFGGVGPSRMPDRHLRGPAPLAAGNAMVVHGDGLLIGVDPANGTERWQLKLPPKSMRYVMPYDGGFSSLSSDGRLFWTVANDEILTIDAMRGEVQQRFAVPEDALGARWGYLAEGDQALFVTTMKGSAPRLELDRAQAREDYTNRDYQSARPLVCSREVRRLSHLGETEWRHRSVGVIPNGSISIDLETQRMLWIEGLSPACRHHASDRVSVATLVEEAQIHCIDIRSGETQWQQPLRLPSAENMLFTQLTEDFVVVVTSRSVQGKAEYVVQVLSASTGELEWETQHQHVRVGLYHGEQVHHPLLLRGGDGDRLFVEPYLYELATGQRLRPAGQNDENWALIRPGHSCGTLSGTGDCIFFRASNPTVFNLKGNSEDAFTQLSPSRPSCWINMIPAGGLLLIPEGSASCVCNYSLQTSMAFAPMLDANSQVSEFLPDFPDIAKEKWEELHAWTIPANLKNSIQPTTGKWTLTPVLEPAAAASDRFDGNVWFKHERSGGVLRLSQTVSFSAWVKLAPRNTKWSGFISAIEDNGNYERGALLGLKDDHFVFGIASSAKQKLTYLSDSAPAPIDEWCHVVGSYDGQTMRLYVNGKLRAVSTSQRGPIAWDRDAELAIGAYKDKNELYPFRGRIHSVSIFRSALPAEEIRNRSREGSPTN